MESSVLDDFIFLYEGCSKDQDQILQNAAFIAKIV